MRVVYFSQDYTPHDYRFLAALAETEHRVHYLRLEDAGLGLESRPLPEAVERIDWSGGRRRLSEWHLPRLWRELRGVLKRLQPDLVHAGPVPRAAFLTALVGYKPLLTMAWGSDLLWETKQRATRWKARYALAASAGLVCDCQAVRARAIELGMVAEKIVVFPWGVDLDHFKPGPSGGLRQELGWEDSFVLISTRAWEPLLGVDVVIRGFIEAAQSRPELRLLMLGSGSKGPEIRELIRDSGLQGHVHYAGYVRHDLLPRYYRTADLYLSASHSDGSSVSLLEAMACGKPALVSDIPGNREWVEPERNGWQFRDGQARDLAGRLITIGDRREQLATMGLEARRIAEARANWPDNFGQLMQAYDRAVAETVP